MDDKRVTVGSVTVDAHGEGVRLQVAGAGVVLSRSQARRLIDALLGVTASNSAHGTVVAVIPPQPPVHEWKEDIPLGRQIVQTVAATAAKITRRKRK